MKRGSGQSRADFIAKTFIALEEAREARYWLTLIAACDPRLREPASPLLAEAEQLVAILFTIVRNARLNSTRK